MTPETQIDVLVVGAGPAGLMCALALARAGVHTRIVDKLPERIKHGRADGLHVRTLEILQTYGLAERIIPLGHRLYTSVTYSTDNPSGSLNRVGNKASTMLMGGRYPFGIMVNQGIVEGVFREAMCETGRQHGEMAYEYPAPSPPRQVRVEQGTSPVWMNYESDFVDVHLRDSSGNLEAVRAKYVIGCDGAHSWVRSQLGYNMEGDHSNAVWGVIDTIPITDFPDIRNHAWINAGQRKCQIIPRENGLVRFYVQLLEADTDSQRFDRSKIKSKDIEEIAKEIFKPYKLEFPQRPQWWTVYVVGQRLATRYSASRRVFLVGDACHTHSPHAGQGMNAAIGDSHNLAWQLVHTLRGWTNPRLLDMYERERRQYAHELIEFDRKLSKVLASKSEKSSDSHQKLLKAFAGFISGTGISYSTTMKQASAFQNLAPRITIGQRVPPQVILRMADSRPFEIHDMLPSDSRFKLLVFGGDMSHNRKAIIQLGRSLACHELGTAKMHDLFGVVYVGKLGENCATMLDVPASLVWHWSCAFVDATNARDGGGQAYRSYGISDDGCVVLVRPDGYVGTIMPLNGEKLTGHLALYLCSLGYPVNLQRRARL
ncbi:Phenol hydroxylase, C-terminal dimerization domain, partial [Rhizoctonia solani]